MMIISHISQQTNDEISEEILPINNPDSPEPCTVGCHWG